MLQCGGLQLRSLHAVLEAALGFRPVDHLPDARHIRGFVVFILHELISQTAPSKIKCDKLT